MRHLTSAVTLLALFLISALAFAQDEGHEEHPFPAPPEDAYLDAMAGSWTSTGTMMGMPVSEAVAMGWELGHQFFVARTTATITMPDGSVFTLESVMMHKPNGDGTYTGFYFDNMGTAGTFSASLADGVMTTEWSDPNHGTDNRSVQVMNEDGTATISFHTQGPDGTWADSGSMVYTRAE